MLAELLTVFLATMAGNRNCQIDDGRGSSWS